MDQFHSVIYAFRLCFPCIQGSFGRWFVLRTVCTSFGRLSWEGREKWAGIVWFILNYVPNEQYLLKLLVHFISFVCKLLLTNNIHIYRASAIHQTVRSQFSLSLSFAFSLSISTSLSQPIGVYSRVVGAGLLHIQIIGQIVTFRMLMIIISKNEQQFKNLRHIHHRYL